MRVTVLLIVFIGTAADAESSRRRFDSVRSPASRQYSHSYRCQVTRKGREKGAKEYEKDRRKEEAIDGIEHKERTGK
jgi:hypothetical protein